MKKKSDMDSFASEYCMSAGDNALRRDQINAAIISKATANEHSFREACMAGLDDIAGARPTGGTPPPPLPPQDQDTRMATDIPGGESVKTATPRRPRDTASSGERLDTRP